MEAIPRDAGLDTTIHLRYTVPTMSLHAVRTRMVSNLSPRHREIMRRLVMGERSRDIAEDMGLSATRVSQISNSPLFRAEMERMAAQVDAATFDAMAALREYQPAAVAVLAESMGNEQYPHLRFKAAVQVLDRTGVAAPRQFQVTQNTVTYEQRLHDVRLQLEQTTDPEERAERSRECPVSVIGMDALPEPPDTGDDEDDED